MELLEQRILRDGRVRPGNILKVDSFFNHRLDIGLLDALGAELARRYAGGDALRAAGVRVESLAIIDRMDESGITFRKG